MLNLKYIEGLFIHVTDTFAILYDDGDYEEKVSSSDLKLLVYPPSKFKKDDKVEALWQEEDDWFPGVVLKENKDGTYHIRYDDGDVEQKVKAPYIRMLKL